MFSTEGTGEWLYVDWEPAKATYDDSRLRKVNHQLHNAALHNRPGALCVFLGKVPAFPSGCVQMSSRYSTCRQLHDELGQDLWNPASQQTIAHRAHGCAEKQKTGLGSAGKSIKNIGNSG